jgi:hypothetical protein
MLRPDGDPRIPSEVDSKNFRTACIEYVLDKFTPYIYPILGGDIELRYLPPDDLYTDPHAALVRRSHEVDKFCADYLLTYKKTPSLLTDEVLDHFSDMYEDAKSRFGPQLIAHAQSLGLVRTLSGAQAKSLTNLHEFVYLSGPHKNTYMDLFRVGWEIFRSADEQKGPILLVAPPADSEDDEAPFQVLYLDELYNRDSKFLKEKILDFHKRKALAHLASSIRYDIELHLVPEDQILPKYLTALEEIPDDESKRQVRKHMGQYLTLLKLVLPDYQRTRKRLQNQLDKMFVIGDGYTTTIQDYLTRLTNHPARPQATQQRAASMNDTLKMFMDKEVDHELPPPSGITFSEVSAVLEKPGYYAHDLDFTESNLRGILDQNAKIAQYYSAIANVNNPQQVEQLLQYYLPDFHQTLTNFKAWAGTNYLGKSRYEIFIEKVAFAFEIAYMTPGKDPLQSLDEAIKKYLWTSIGVKEAFPGISMLGPSDQITFHNSHLAMVLPLITVNRIRADLLAQIGTSYQRTEYLLDQALQFKQLEPVLQAAYTNKYSHNDSSLIQRLEQIRSDRALFDRFVKALDISQQEIDKLTQIAKGYDAHLGEIFYDDTFSILFSLLYFEKILPNARASIQTLAFREFLQSLYPGVSPDIWDRYLRPVE